MATFGTLQIDFDMSQLCNPNIFITSLKYLKCTAIANAMNSQKGLFPP